MRTLICLTAVLALGVGCKKNEKKAKPATTAAKTTDKVEKDAPPAAEMTVTSKSPEAVAAFQIGRDKVDNLKEPAARDDFKKAVELDPDFALALAYLGTVTPGAEGMVHLDKAKSLAAKLPEAERLFVEALHLERSGDMAAAVDTWEKASTAAAGDWRILIHLATVANAAGDADEAMEFADKAAKIKPDLALAHNILAYAHAGRSEWDKAIAAAQKQVELLPQEPNPNDTLGEIYLMAGKFDESEKAYQAALAVDPKFGIAWQGVAMARAYRGDFKGAAEAIEKDRKAAPTPEIAAAITSMLAWMKAAEGKLPEALKLLDQSEKDPAIQKGPAYAGAAVERAHFLQLSGKYPDAAKWYATAVKRAETLPGAGKRGIGVTSAVGLLRNAALSGKGAETVDAQLAVVEKSAAELPDSPRDQSIASWARGLAAWAKGGAKDGPKAAIAELSKCREDLVVCRYDLAVAQRKAGDAAAADATEKDIRETPLRDVGAVYVYTLLAKAQPKVATPKAPAKGEPKAEPKAQPASQPTP